MTISKQILDEAIELGKNYFYHGRRDEEVFRKYFDKCIEISNSINDPSANIFFVIDTFISYGASKKLYQAIELLGINII